MIIYMVLAASAVIEKPVSIVAEHSVFGSLGARLGESGDYEVCVWLRFVFVVESVVNVSSSAFWLSTTVSDLGTGSVAEWSGACCLGLVPAASRAQWSDCSFAA
jgi:hypothetical protein